MQTSPKNGMKEKKKEVWKFPFQTSPTPRLHGEDQRPTEANRLQQRQGKETDVVRFVDESIFIKIPKSRNRLPKFD